ncbi:DHA2 family efflux MFS transporter permease subunit [Williamsia sterculiae]|uniref:Drug resistance transporter, EmrB/QacA subfamily n=1 Tax=Williamsia sterculiae TaxID=1344003 RepID=A0A1N7CHU4_9NOCA|nr:DHA2 family efflux MFS transporter permease subunit [Williamsia sterculiae]SIR63159.1 drug resistance transporter, EmrB/QacA subfamily [Williamsia sterculiae]
MISTSIRTREVHRWWALAALCLAELLVMIDNTIVNVALPTISRDLSAGISGLQWVVDAYTLVFAGLLLTGGYIGDRFGRRRALVVGIVGFASVSVVAATSTGLSALIAARAGLGVFAALVFPATLALVTHIFTDPRGRAAAVGIWSATAGVAVAIGPVLGGWLLEHYSWSSVFWINVPIGVGVMAIVLLVVPSPTPEQVGKLDVLGVLLSIVGLSLLTYSVIEGPHHGWGDYRTVGGLILSLVVLGLFVRREARIEFPILDVTLFMNRRFAAASGMIAVAFFALMGFIFLITQYFQAVQGYGALEAGLRTLPFAVVMAALSPVAMVVAKTFGAGRVAAVGSALMTAGFAVVEFSTRESSYWGLIVWSMSLMAAGLAMIAGPCTQIIMDSLTPAQAGAGSAVNDTTRELGGTLGVAVLGSILTSAYTAAVAGKLADVPMPADAKNAATESVMAGVEVAARAPETMRGALTTAIQDTFVTGLHNAVYAAISITALGAVIGWFMLRDKGVESPNGTHDSAAVEGDSDGALSDAEVVGRS